LHNLGVEAGNRGDLAAAERLSGEALDLMRRRGSLPLLPYALNNLAYVAVRRGDHGRAVGLLEEALAQARAIRDEWTVAMTLGNLAEALAKGGDRGAALAVLRERLGLARKLGDRPGMAAAVEAVATAAAASHPTEATRLLGGAGAQLDAIGVALLPEERAERDEATAGLRATIGQAAFAAAWEAGEAMPLEEAVAEALALADELAAQAGGPTDDREEPVGPIAPHGM
jgi:tetratricopeptide (TPR) repeat protein